MDSNNENAITGCNGCSKVNKDCSTCSGCGGGFSQNIDEDFDSTPGCGGKSCCGGCGGEAPRGKLHCTDWLEDIPGGFNNFDIVEVQFKNTRKGFYRNTNNLDLNIGDIVAVEATPGHDIGEIVLTGKLVAIQMKKANLRPDFEILRVFRKAKPNDLEKFEIAKGKEIDTMIRSRKIAESLKLNMKIGDVEYQGDGNKAIFYYIADERVDFRQLIKILADTFKIRIEMKQIGARQEAGRIGGIGPCGRPLCCSSWMSNFVSVSTNAARFQDISLNPQKLAGQCAKLKCCLNFEVDTYVEGTKRMPPKEAVLETKDSTYYHFKSDIFKREVTYSTDRNVPANLVTLSVSRVFEIMAFNKQGIRPEKLLLDEEGKKQEKKEFGDIIGQDSVTRFDKNKKKKNNRNAGPKRPMDINQRREEGNENRRPNNNNRQYQNPNAPKDDNNSKPQAKPNPQEAGEARLNQNVQRPPKKFVQRNGQQQKNENDGDSSENNRSSRQRFNGDRRRPKGNNDRRRLEQKAPQSENKNNGDGLNTPAN